MSTTDAHATQVEVRRGLFVGGEWLDSANGGLRDIRWPADGAFVTTVIESSATDASRALASAREVFDDGVWASVVERERGELIGRVADLLVRDKAIYAPAEATSGRTSTRSRPVGSGHK